MIVAFVSPGKLICRNAAVEVRVDGSGTRMEPSSVFQPVMVGMCLWKRPSRTRFDGGAGM